MKRVFSILVLLSATALLLVACGDDDDLPTGGTCGSVDDCYNNLEDEDRDALAGEIRCLSSNVPDGYCTHTCQTDDDCCTVEGECSDGFDFVCASLENQNEKFCFLACEGVDDESNYCQDNLNTDSFTCRSTGGGNQNRKVCLP